MRATYLAARIAGYSPFAERQERSAVPRGVAMRQLWQAVEALHDVVYFAPAAGTAYAEIGCRGWWMGYFASRAAALGPVGPDVVSALFFGFAPRMVERAIPDAWQLADREEVLAARRRIAGDAL